MMVMKYKVQKFLLAQISENKNYYLMHKFDETPEWKKALSVSIILKVLDENVLEQLVFIIYIQNLSNTGTFPLKASKTEIVYLMNSPYAAV